MSKSQEKISVLRNISTENGAKRPARAVRRELIFRPNFIIRGMQGDKQEKMRKKIEQKNPGLMLLSSEKFS